MVFLLWTILPLSLVVPAFRDNCVYWSIMCNEAYDVVLYRDSYQTEQSEYGLVVSHYII